MFSFSSRRRHTRSYGDWSSDVCSSDLGRHHWLAKHANTTAVLAFATPDDEELAAKTLALLPAGVPVVREPIAFGGLARSEERRVGKECRYVMAGHVTMRMVGKLNRTTV